ncbi:hypothetical protein K491DRAFT_614350 [Lophiostoma macrostomum CBS 122681]|uniref:Actin-like ATPase domain-containing protein n=1 Tax=Lophiostoma macrostomum CBS 122681 TaxID=1314788 RepID=A0A6A6SN40_9PLEO|nr:hypothetical protein K491DRAFT_614350 [Lophiostoma macrostomum CBS 122681]
MDVVQCIPSIDTDSPKDHDRLVIAIDLGTTFSSVAYTRILKGQSPAHHGIEDVHCVDEYPDYRAAPPEPSRQDVPTELWYDIDGKSTTTNSSLGPEEAYSDEELLDGEYTSHAVDSEEDQETTQTPQSSENGQSTGEAPKSKYWGFGVQKQFRTMNVPADDNRQISRFKLLLDHQESTQEVRSALAPMIKKLKAQKLIKKETDLFTHYLTHLLRHTKTHLHRKGFLKPELSIEFVICVPAKWPSKACRIMQAAMKAAVRESGIGDQVQHSIDDFFLVSEPEAAATCVFAEKREVCEFGEVVVILDAGGGTIDAVTYEVTRSDPLRMDAEVVAANSILSGGSYINERFNQILTKILSPVRGDIEIHGNTMKSIVDVKVLEFENGEKRSVDTTLKGATIEPIRIDGLQEKPGRRRFCQNLLKITPTELNNIYAKPLNGAKEALKDQLEKASAERRSVNSVILTGGFGQSPALRSYLSQYLSEQKNFDRGGIKFTTPDVSCTAVARGAVLRAIRKANGPDRISQCSYGVLVDDPYDPDRYAAHKCARQTPDADGNDYVTATIEWLIQKGMKLNNAAEFYIPVKHTIDVSQKRLICTENLYVSDGKHDSHFKKSHAHNKGHELAGEMKVDMTFLKTKKLIKPQRPWHMDEKTSKAFKQGYWNVEFEIVLVIHGRNLRYEARWPRRDHLQPGQVQTVCKRGQVCIAAAFPPGTA